jgi:hypothetical protein
MVELKWLALNTVSSYYQFTRYQDVLHNGVHTLEEGEAQVTRVSGE